LIPAGEPLSAYRNDRVVSFSSALQRFRSGDDHPRRFLERCIENIEKHEPAVKAWVTLDLAAARAAADASAKRYRQGAPLSSVDGCPVAIKDIIATADMPTQMNSPVFAGWQSGQDAACVQALRKGGAIILGKTVTTEFAIGHSGPTTNPHDAARTPGGSSSGTAAAVGCGMVPVGLGTQTQGSTLRPASYCGAVGYKGSLGVLPLGGVHPLSVTHDHLGVIGGTLDDVWRVASRISLAIGSPGQPFLTAAGDTAPPARRPAKLIRLYLKGWEEVDAPTRAVTEETFARLQRQGIAISTRDDDPDIARLERLLDEGVAQSLDMVAYEMKWPFIDYVERWGDKIGERIRALVARADELTPADYERLLENRTRIRAQVREVARKADAFVTLAASSVAPVGHEFTGSRTFLAYWSWTGFPAFALPLMSVGGLPLGLQLMGFGGEDGALAAAANWMMQARDD
jgi:Asp-tRNA(Asn)/Glu-tRNA(Gln) amidotransferase A subunit family amidase